MGDLNKLSKVSANPVPKIYHSKPILFDIQKIDGKMYRADVELYGVDHSGMSYEGRIFLNNTNANQETPKNIDNGYAGSFYIFGHGGKCFGDIGHCTVPAHQRRFDHRRSHPLTPIYTRVIVTETLEKIAKTTNQITISIVPVVTRTKKKYSESILRFKKLKLITYS